MHYRDCPRQSARSCLSGGPSRLERRRRTVPRTIASGLTHLQACGPIIPRAVLESIQTLARYLLQPLSIATISATFIPYEQSSVFVASVCFSHFVATFGATFFTRCLSKSCRHFAFIAHVHFATILFYYVVPFLWLMWVSPRSGQHIWAYYGASPAQVVEISSMSFAESSCVIRRLI